MSKPEPTKSNTSPTEEIPAELIELTEVVDKLPEPYRSQMQQSVERVVSSSKRRRRLLSLVQDALSQLRLDMKYLAFDLEATRRERDDYRRQLEESS